MIIIFRKWISDNPDSEQTHALVEIFEERVATLPPSPLADAAEAKALNEFDTQDRTNITFDVFTLTFCQEIFDNPDKGLEDEE